MNETSIHKKDTPKGASLLIHIEYYMFISALPLSFG
jgi:hypothetical protein